MKRKRQKKKGEQKTERHSLPAVAVATLVGSVLAFLGGRWIAAGRIEYWTGSTERHHFIATDSMPVFYWTIALIFCVGGAALWAKSIADLIGWVRSRT
jgi:hypothetical protein